MTLRTFGLAALVLAGSLASTSARAAKVSIGVWHYYSSSYPSASKIKSAYEAHYGRGNVTVTSVSFNERIWPTYSQMSKYDVVIINRFARSAPYKTSVSTEFDKYIAGGGHAIIIGEQEGLSGRLFPDLLKRFGLTGSGTNSRKPRNHGPLSPSAMDTASGRINSTGSFETYAVKKCFGTYDSDSEFIFPGQKPGDGSLVISGEVQRFSALSAYSGDSAYLRGIAKMHYTFETGSLADLYKLDKTGIIDPKHPKFPCDPSYIPPCVSPTTWYRDADGDGWGNPSVTTKTCKTPTGYVTRSGDCNDSDRTVNPGATEVIADGGDQTCDGKEVCYVNQDGDGHRTASTRLSTDADCSDSGEALRTLPGIDCNDTDASIYPGATEIIADGIDQDCNGRESCYVDFDNDGWRLSSSVLSSDADCADPGEATAGDPATDCDDRDAFTYPGATEVIADAKDQSCDGREICYIDGDGDRYRTSSTVMSSDEDCADSGEALSSMTGGDCDDADPATYPGAFEVIGDEKDQSCDGGEICYSDVDRDGWRIDTTRPSLDTDCRDPGEASSGVPGIDCDDSDGTVYPSAPETAYDGTDQDCNGEDLCDVDEDGFDAGIGACTGSDCDDDDLAVHPAADEVWYDGTDQDCDGWSDFDADRDGFDSVDYGGEDCDDADSDVHIEAEEIWYDGIDQDCDGASDYDQDGDGYDSAEFGGEDCDDLDHTVHPGAPELPDGIDNDCNGVDEDDDTDGDGLTDEDELDLGTDPEDPDTDGDGVWDGVEVGDGEEALDTDGDGVIDALDLDDDGDGIPTEDETGGTEPGSSLGDYPDTDGDGTPDFRDTDSDDDGYLDGDEGVVDSDGDGTPDLHDLDSDDDGVPDERERDEDSDGDGVRDRLDTDDDDDGLPTRVEGEVDTDGDGKPDYLDVDSDDDGRTDLDEGGSDRDCDNTLNYLDADDADGPCAGTSDLTASYQSGACTGADTSGLGFGGLGLVVLGLIGLRRRRAA